MEFINLDVAVVKALDYFQGLKLPKINVKKYSRPLVIGSGNAFLTGKILFEGTRALFADESTYKDVLSENKGINGCFLISSSGAKHAPLIAKDLKKRKIKTTLITNNEHSLSKKYVSEQVVFPCLKEPYTYNVSTYLGMLLSKTGEDPQKILSFLVEKTNLPEDLSSYDAFYILLPSKYMALKEMFLTKFDELFGPKISCRVFTIEQTKHAKTVVESDSELFCSLGVKNTSFGNKRYEVSLPKNSGVTLLFCLGYYLIGHIQKANKPYFKESLERYLTLTSKLFNQKQSDFHQ